MYTFRAMDIERTRKLLQTIWKQDPSNLDAQAFSDDKRPSVVSSLHNKRRLLFQDQRPSKNVIDMTVASVWHARYKR